MNSGPPFLGVRVKAYHNQARLTFSVEQRGAVPGPSDSPGTPDLPTECGPTRVPGCVSISRRPSRSALPKTSEQRLYSSQGTAIPPMWIL